MSSISSSRNYSNFLLITTLLILLAGLPPIHGSSTRFRIKEATVRSIRHAFNQNKLTSRQLTKLYLGEIKKLNPLLKGVIEVNPDALAQADMADRERLSARTWSSLLPGLHGIPILLKDNIGTKDKLNTTAGSFALLGSVVPRDAGVVARLRKSGAVILGKASMSEWAEFRSLIAPSGWSARGGQAKNPYVLSADPCGSSSGSSISVAANMVAVSLGTETDGSILCPASANSVVGIKPTVGLTSRSGVIPITPRQDTVGPICRTVADAVYVLDAIAGVDRNDANATRQASRYIPKGGYTQFLKKNGLRGKRIGIVRDPFFNFTNSPTHSRIFNKHFQTLRQEGAVVVDNLKIDNIEAVLNVNLSGEAFASIAEFKISVNEYLKNLVASPVRSLADVIAFNQNNPKLEMMEEFGQDVFLLAESTSGIGITEQAAILNMEKLTKEGFKKVMKSNRLDAIVTQGSSISPLLAIGGFPGISIPAGYGYDDTTGGVPFGICFAGLKGSEPSLIEIAYAFEQATNIRNPPSFHP